MDWTKLVIAVGAIITALAIIMRWFGDIIERRVMEKLLELLNNPRDGFLTLIEERMQKIEIDMVRATTWLDINKAMLATHGGARHESPFEIDTAWLRDKIVSSGYVPDPVMLTEFRRIVDDPLTPEDDGHLWSVIEHRFGAEALAQETMKFNAPGETAPAIWVLCIRRAQRIGADALLSEIGISPPEVVHDDGA